MNGSCVYEERAIAALGSENMDSQLRDHIAGCAECSQAAAIARFLREQTQITTLAHRPLPDADVIWWTAHLRARAAAVNRATLPIKFTQAIGAIAACAAGVFALRSPELQTWLAPMMRVVPSNPMIVLTGALALAGTLFGGVYFVLKDCISQ